MPKMGESIIEAEIIQWLKQEGDTITQEESILEVATDKVDTEIPATHTGILKKILAPKGTVIPIGKPIAILQKNTDKKHTIPPTAINHINTKQKNYNPLLPQSQKKHISPLVQKIAKTKNISTNVLQKIQGTGINGRITKKDLDSYLDTVAIQSKNIDIHNNTHEEIIMMDRMRKIIAQRMLTSKKTSPHVTSFVEADVTKIVRWKKKIQEKFQKKFHLHLTYTPIFLEAIVKAIQKYPLINSSIEGEKIIIKKNINIGLAVALSNGNLVVPVIKNAHLQNLLSLTKNVLTLAKKARENTLTSDELLGATYTVSNIGSFGSIMGTPIIMQPQVAILALGAITKKPAVIETAMGDSIGIRHKMFLSHTYDHRIIDGMLGGLFAQQVAKNLENFDEKTYDL